MRTLIVRLQVRVCIKLTMFKTKRPSDVMIRGPFFTNSSYSSLLCICFNPQKKIAVPDKDRNKNRPRPRGEPHERIAYHTSIVSSFS